MPAARRGRWAGGGARRRMNRMDSQTIELAGEEVRLLARRALYHARSASLFVADLHLGKTAAFRSAGIPVPEGATARDLERLSGLVQECGAQRLVILGDLLHARSGRSADVLEGFERWRAAHAGLHVMLVRGNHDRSSGDPPEGWKIECRSAPVVEGPFALSHEPGESAGAAGYELCGHVHPAVRMAGPGGASMRAACFWIGAERAVLPAFGGFTGAKVVQPRCSDRIFVVGDGSIVEVKLMSAGMEKR